MAELIVSKTDTPTLQNAGGALNWDVSIAPNYDSKDNFGGYSISVGIPDEVFGGVACLNENLDEVLSKYLEGQFIYDGGDSLPQLATLLETYATKCRQQYKKIIENSVDK